LWIQNKNKRYLIPLTKKNRENEHDHHWRDKQHSSRQQRRQRDIEWIGRRAVNIPDFAKQNRLVSDASKKY